MKFCSDCGGSIEQRVPLGDDRQRFVCADCDAIHYVNPRVIVGCLPVFEDKILLCKRAIEPRYGYWTLPAGFMENGESTEEGAARETWEEARAQVHNMHLYRVFDVPHINQVYLFYRCEVEDGLFGVGPESLESGFYREDEVPWDNIAFAVVKNSLRAYFEDRRRNDYPVAVETIIFPDPRKP